MVYIKKLVMKGFKSFVRKTDIPFTPEINIILGPNGSGKSCSYDTRVLLSNGKEIEIGKLVEDQIKSSGNIKKLDDGIYVNGKGNVKILSLNKKSMKIEEKPISKFIKREGEKLYKITTKTGKDVKATECHPVLIFRDGKVQSTVIRDLTKGNLIASPRILKVKSKEVFNPDIARLIGYIIGDGYIAKDRIEFVNKDKEIINDFYSILEKHFKVETRERHEKNITRIYIRDKNFVKYIKDLFIRTHKSSITAKDKKIPDILLGCNNKVISNLLAGLYDTDGSVRKDIATIEFCTKNKELAKNIHGLLLRYGIVSKIKERLSSAKNTKARIKRPYFYIYIYGIENLRKFYYSIPLRVKYKKQSIEAFLKKKIVPNPNNDVLPREVNHIIRECKNTLRIPFKPIRKQFPSFGAYLDNRCCPTRQGVNNLILLFEEKLGIFEKSLENLKGDQKTLMNIIRNLRLSRVGAPEYIGVTRHTVTAIWDKGVFKAKKENLRRLYKFVKKEIEERIKNSKKLILNLKKISRSNIFWDEITEIEELKGEDWVYDLCVDEHHNFIANNIFVHNSNITDALCFVLGRLSIKSIRAAKAKNLIFMGTKAASPAKEAMVEIVFDNTDSTFSIDGSELSIKRIVRKTGQSTYKINNHIKTRQEVLTLLAQAGIDPHGFNIILQGEIQNFVRMHTEERRKIIEEVSGIAIYESRKQKSLRELEKTAEKLKEINAVLKERTSYLNNLEKERQQALRYKKLEKDIKKYKASIINFDLRKNKKEEREIISHIEKKNKEIEKIKKTIAGVEARIRNYESKIVSINSTIQKSTGLEQEKLNQEITNLRADLAGVSVNIENNEKKLSQTTKQKQELSQAIKEGEFSIREIQRELGVKKPKKRDKQREIELKKQELERLEEQRKRFYMLKSDLKSSKEKLNDKNYELQNYNSELEFLAKQIRSLAKELFDKKTSESKINALKVSLDERKQILDDLRKKEIELEKISYNNEHEIERRDKLIEKISKMDICPLCKSKITEEHIDSMHKELFPKIDFLKREVESSDKELSEIYKKKEILEQDIEHLTSEISNRGADLIKISNIREKEQQIKSLQNKIQEIGADILNLEKRRKAFEKKIEQDLDIEQKYETLRLEVQEASLISEEDLGSEMVFKKRELERAKISLKQLFREEQEVKEELSTLRTNKKQKQALLEKKKKQEEELTKKFQGLISERDGLYKKIRESESELSQKQNLVYNIEQEINNLKIEKARVDATIENLESEMLEFSDLVIVKGKREKLVQRLIKTQETFSRIGSVNLRSLEVYDSIKKEYDAIKEKVSTIEGEKEGILKIIHEIDIKKKKTFLKTLTALNEIFSKNFSELSTKGQVYLELENRKEPFEAGVSIIVKTGHGKYFDVTSLSGGEQTIVALSLIFAIQELNPYCFYVLDEVDAALDKRNSERLARLLKKHMKKGQYVIITHNDEVISNADTLYGVSMHEGISKIVSLLV